MKTTLLIGGGIVILLIFLYVAWPAIENIRDSVYESQNPEPIIKTETVIVDRPIPVLYNVSPPRPFPRPIPRP